MNKKKKTNTDGLPVRPLARSLDRPTDRLWILGALVLGRVESECMRVLVSVSQSVSPTQQSVSQIVHAVERNRRALVLACVIEQQQQQQQQQQHIEELIAASRKGEERES